jgi:hypothetical protein
MDVIACLVIGKRDVKWAIGFDQAHHQALGIWPGSGLLLKYLSFVDHPQGLRSGNASFSGAHQGMVAPEDVLRVRCAADWGGQEPQG